MPSTPLTSGYRASVMPQVQFADPRLFNPYGELSTGLTQGVKMAEDIQQMRLRKALEEREIERERRAQEQAAYEMTQRPLEEQRRRLQIEEMNAKLNQPVWDGSTRRMVRHDPTRAIVDNNPFLDNSLSGGGAPVDMSFASQPLIGNDLSLVDQAQQERQSMVAPRFAEPQGVAQPMMTRYQPGGVNEIVEIQEGRNRDGSIARREKTILDAYDIQKAQEKIDQENRRLDIADFSAHSLAQARVTAAEAKAAIATGRWKPYGNKIINDLTGAVLDVQGLVQPGAAMAAYFMGDTGQPTAPTTLPQPAGSGEVAGTRLNLQAQSNLEAQRVAQIAAANDAKAKALIQMYKDGRIRSKAELEAAMVAAGLPR